jgi:hypothetical protein
MTTPVPHQIIHEPISLVSYKRFQQTDALNLHYLAKCGNQRLCQPEGEYKLGAGHEQLGRQTLEEGRKAFVLHHFGDNLEPTLWVLKVPVLDARLDDVESL